MTPLILFAIYLLFQWILGEDPREALLKDENVKSWEFFLEQELYGGKGNRTEYLYYAVFDSSEDLANEVREEILKNDWYLFLLNVFEMTDDEFDSFRHSFSEEDSGVPSALENWRQINANFSHEQLIAQIVGHVPPHDTYSNADISTFKAQLAKWWEMNLESIKALVPTVSSNFFDDVTPLNATEDDLDSMLASREIIGYFLISDNVGEDNAETKFIARLDTPRGQILDLVNWYRSIGSDVLQKRHFEKTGIEPETLQRLLLRAEFETNDVVIEESGSKLIPKSFYKFVYVALPIVLYLVFFISSVRLVANIVEEKSSKLAESLLANLSPINLLDGKLWGTALISLTVATVWAVLIPLFVIITGRWNSNIDPTIIGLLFRPDVVLNFLLFLTLAYALYGYFIVAFTSRFSRLNNALSAVLYVQLAVLFLFVTPTILIPFITFKGLQDALSFFPLSTPFVMVARSGSLPDWPIFFAIVFVMVLCVLGSRALSGSLFARGITDEFRVSRTKKST